MLKTGRMSWRNASKPDDRRVADSIVILAEGTHRDGNYIEAVMSNAYWKNDFKRST
jgi:hypothetical protein